MDSAEKAKVALEATLAQLRDRGAELLDRVNIELAGVEAQDQDFEALLSRLHAASARLPIRPYNRYYTHDMKPATQPLISGMMDSINNAHFGELPSEYVDEMIERYQKPAADAVRAVFDEVTDYFRVVSTRVLTLRFFSNADVLLAKFENALSYPWCVQADLSVKFQYTLPAWLCPPVHDYLPHFLINQMRSAYEDTLRLLRTKLHEIVATLETAVMEIPFAEKLEREKPVPQTLIDYSTHIEQGVTIEGSAIGQGAQRGR